MLNIQGIETDISKSSSTRAYEGVSFYPEKRGEKIIEEYICKLEQLACYIDEKAKDDRQKEIAQKVFDRLRDKYKSRTLSWLSAQSRCISSMIAGPSNFPVRRAEKANASEHKRCGELVALEKAMFRYAEKSLSYAIPTEEKRRDEVERMRVAVAQAENTQSFMKAANAAHRKGDIDALKSLFKDKAGNVNEAALQAFLKPNYMGRVGFEGWQMSNNLANIKRMLERLQMMESKAQATGSDEQELNNLTIIRNHAEDRLQLVFAGKPSEEERTALKQNGFKWSPRFGAWQRQLTPNAEAALTHRILNNQLFAKYATGKVA